MNIPTIKGIILLGSQIHDIIPKDRGVIHIPTVILFIENMVLKNGEYLPIQIPKNKIVEAIIISFFVIKTGERDKSTPVIIWGIFRIISSWDFFLFLFINSPSKSENTTNVIKVIIDK